MGTMLTAWGWTFAIAGMLAIPVVPLLVMALVLSGMFDRIGLYVIVLAVLPFVLIPLSLCLTFLGAELQRPVEGRCVRCGYDLRGLHGRICPECGTEF